MEIRELDTLEPSLEPTIDFTWKKETHVGIKVDSKSVDSKSARRKRQFAIIYGI
jgi:hypothetical protein